MMVQWNVFVFQFWNFLCSFFAICRCMYQSPTRLELYMFWIISACHFRNGSPNYVLFVLNLLEFIRQVIAVLLKVLCWKEVYRIVWSYTSQNLMLDEVNSNSRGLQHWRRNFNQNQLNSESSPLPRNLWHVVESEDQKNTGMEFRQIVHRQRNEPHDVNTYHLLTGSAYYDCDTHFSV